MKIKIKYFFSRNYFDNIKVSISLRLLTRKVIKGLVVQLVRIHACHAWGRGFESRPDREIGKSDSEMNRFFAQKCPAI